MVKHRFTNPKADGGDATITRPSNWNDREDIVRTVAENSVIPTGCAWIVPGYLEISAGIELELSADTEVEIT